MSTEYSEFSCLVVLLFVTHVKFAHCWMKQYPYEFLSHRKCYREYILAKRVPVFQRTLFPESRRKFRNAVDRANAVSSSRVHAESTRHPPTERSQLNCGSAAFGLTNAIWKNANAKNSRARRAKHSSLGQLNMLEPDGDRKRNYKGVLKYSTSTVFIIGHALSQI